MLDWFDHLLAALDSHPAVVAWLVAWPAALVCSQTVKEFLIPTRWPAARVKRVVQLVAISIGAIVAFMLWPAGATSRRVVLAVIVGMSAPTAYTFIKACIEVRFPNLADALSWQSAKLRRGYERPPKED